MRSHHSSDRFVAGVLLLIGTLLVLGSLLIVVGWTRALEALILSAMTMLGIAIMMAGLRTWRD